MTVVVSLLTAVGGNTASAQTEDPYTFYQNAGSWETTQETADVPGASDARIFYPEDLGANGHRHPIVTAAFIDDEELRHLASWGFVAIRAEEENPGSGDEILAAAQWLVDQDNEPGSPFYSALDTGNVGALGFSQGAGGVVNATMKSNGLITSTVPLALPNRVFWACEGDDGGLPWWLMGCEAPPEPDWAALTGSVLYLTGTDDWTSNGDVSAVLGFPMGSFTCLLIQWLMGVPCNPNDQQYFYHQTPAPAAKVEAIGIDHQVPDFYLGYLTAWFKYTLEAEDLARTAFAGPSPQIASDPAWTKWKAKGLP